MVVVVDAVVVFVVVAVVELSSSSSSKQMASTQTHTRANACINIGVIKQANTHSISAGHGRQGALISDRLRARFEHLESRRNTATGDTGWTHIYDELRKLKDQAKNQSDGMRELERKLEGRGARSRSGWC